MQLLGFCSSLCLGVPGPVCVTRLLDVANLPTVVTIGCPKFASFGKVTCAVATVTGRG